MTSPEGGFYSATDADSPTPSGHDEEGWFFTWTPDELEGLLGADDAAVVSAAFGASARGNFEGRNILHRVQTNREVARALHMPPKRVAEVLATSRRTLYDARALRPPPIRDEKIIAAWNGLMISAFAQAAWMLDEARYASAAAGAAEFVVNQMRGADGALVRTYRDGKKATTSFLDDYAFMVGACLDLYEATAGIVWLQRAVELQSDQDTRYIDAQSGGYYLAPAGGETLLVREKPAYDGAVPSGNSVAAGNLLRLHDLTGDAKWRRWPSDCSLSGSFTSTRSPIGFPLLLSVASTTTTTLASRGRAHRSPRAGKRQPARRAASQDASCPTRPSPFSPTRKRAEQQAQVPWLEAKRAMGGKSTAYVCERGRCDLPTPSPGVFQKQLDRRKPYPSFDETPPPRLPFERAK